MKIAPDTNLLIRLMARDDEKQARVSLRLLKEASLIAISLPCLCEFVWVLESLYRFGRQDIFNALETLLHTDNVVVNRPAVDAGLAILKAGGDFADGVIAFEGRRLGGETFISFDKKAVSLITKQGFEAKLAG